MLKQLNAVRPPGVAASARHRWSSPFSRSWAPPRLRPRPAGSRRHASDVPATGEAAAQRGPGDRDPLGQERHLAAAALDPPAPIRPAPDREANPNPAAPIKGTARPEAARQTSAFPQRDARAEPQLRRHPLPRRRLQLRAARHQRRGRRHAVRADGQRGLPGLQQDHRRLGARPGRHRDDLVRLRRRLPDRTATATRSCSTTSSPTAGSSASSPARASRPTSASPSRRRATPPARTTATASTSARTSSTTRSSAVWPDAYYMRMNVFNSQRHGVSRPAAVRVRPRRDAGRDGRRRSSRPASLAPARGRLSCPPTSTARSCRRPARRTRSSMPGRARPGRSTASTSTSRRRPTRRSRSPAA